MEGSTIENEASEVFGECFERYSLYFCWSFDPIFPKRPRCPCFPEIAGGDSAASLEDLVAEESNEFEALLESELEITTLGTADELDADVSIGSTVVDELTESVFDEPAESAIVRLAEFPLPEGLPMADIAISKSSSESEDLREESLIALDI